MKLILSFGIALLYLQTVLAQTTDLKTLRRAEKNNPTKQKLTAVGKGDEKDSISVRDAHDLIPAEKAAFVLNNIPSVISKSGMAPAFFDNFSFGFGDDEVAIATGDFFSRDKTKSFGGEITAEAPNGSRTVFQPGGKIPYDFGLELKFTKEKKAKKWKYIENGTTKSDISSVKFEWINVSLSSNLGELVLFSNDTVNYTQSPFTFEAVVSYNSNFNSFIIQRYVNRRFIWNAGIGIGRFTNYSELEEISLRKGTVYNSNQFSEKEIVTGRNANDYKVFNGLVIRAAAYKPVTDPFSYTAIHIGATLSSFGIGSKNHLLGGTTGLYFSRWKSEDDEDNSGKKSLKELFSVGLIADFGNLQNLSKSDYMKDNLKIVLSAQIPLSFF